MNETKELTDLDKLRFLKSNLTSEALDVYKKCFGNNSDYSFHYNNFVPFCHAYAEHLLTSGLFNDYGDFINEFNRLIENDKVQKIHKDIQNYNFAYQGVISFFNHNYDKVFISDKRPKIAGKEFKKETDLERIIEEGLIDYFGKEIDIKRQQKHGYGKSDITINNEITIELKKSKAKRMDVYQTFEYSFDENLKDVCLLASQFDEKSLSIANKLNVSCYSYSFMYEESERGFPFGFIVEKENNTKINLFDEYLESMEEGVFWISFYDPNFHFGKCFMEKMKIVDQIANNTNRINEDNKNRFLKMAEEQGFDITGGLAGLIEQTGGDAT